MRSSQAAIRSACSSRSVARCPAATAEISGKNPLPSGFSSLGITPFYQSGPRQGSKRTVLEPSWSYLSDLVRGLYPGTPELVPRPMKGGASTRKFFRIDLGSERKSAVALFVPGPPTHEIHKDLVNGRGPFIEARQLMADR